MAKIKVTDAVEILSLASTTHPEAQNHELRNASYY